MPRRQILTERQRSTLLDLPTDDASLLLHYTLADDDLVHIRGRRWDHNRLGFGHTSFSQVNTGGQKYDGSSLA
jgi:hypothetical protein